MSGAAGMRPYRLRKRGVTATALMSPMLAASLAVALPALATLVFLSVTTGLDRNTGLQDWLEFLAVFALATVWVLVRAIALTYLAASPLIAAAWMLVHGLGWRGPRDLALAMGAAGFIFGAVFFGLFYGLEVALLMAPCGLISGVITGLFISTRAYERVAPPEPGVDAAPG
ncbi:MAG: hypothetical protein JJU18_02300 [Oceanicaulis sp.]|nr:hypothetical protein [Oceanicaulis sp.]